MGQVDRTGPIISPPYPEVTLDNFGFPVGGRLAARRAVFRPQQPKVTLTRPKMQKWPLWAIGAEKQPAERLNGRLPENQSYPELPQDMGDL